MGQAVSIHDYPDVISPSISPNSFNPDSHKIHSAKSTPNYGQNYIQNDDKIRSSSISRSASNRSLSQLSSASNMSSISSINVR
mmetsp:Transcript_15895/g.14268  ORF Transcript_15895/g.14268 Transcript_15895/m.14268 type:complete len:83 (-) Transcript_15895:1-249(-)